LAPPPTLFSAPLSALYLHVGQKPVKIEAAEISWIGSATL
jgi:hypothetical protein